MRTELKRPAIEPTGSATYCPEDDKLRLYVGRVPREEYDYLRQEGWTATPKQACQFAAVWSVDRENTALAYSGGVLEDEDQNPAERAADRAERFAGYREKRTGEALDKADTYEAGPKMLGYQSAALAERKERALDRCADRAVNLWEKASYWQQRTEGVIAHALHKSAPGVRMGRIKTLEAEQRRIDKAHGEWVTRYNAWKNAAAIADPDKRKKTIGLLADLTHSGEFVNPKSGKACYMSDLFDPVRTPAEHLLTHEEAAAVWLARYVEPAEQPAGRYYNHIILRLAYENQMLEAQGGRAASVDMVPGGWLGEHQIMKVNKSPATGRVVSVAVKVPRVEGWAYKVANVPGTDYALMTIKTERLKKEVYTAPTPEDLEAFETEKKAEKKTRAATVPKGPPLINPTVEEAEKLQAIWNATFNKRVYGEVRAVMLMTQEQYTAAGKQYSKPETKEISAGGFHENPHYDAVNLPPVARVRCYYGQVIVITDKPQKPLTPEMWHDPRPAMLADVSKRIEELHTISRKGWTDEMSEEQKELWKNARLVGLAYQSSMSQFGLTDEGFKVLEAARKAV